MKRFLICSNTRCGSTWLLTALHQLDGVFADYEVKIPPLRYRRGENHFVLEENNLNLLWEKFPDSCVVQGSKLVLDPVYYNSKHFDPVDKAINSDIIIIVLTRKLYDQSMSWLRGGPRHSVSHSVNKGNKLLEVIEQERTSPTDRKIEHNEIIQQILKRILGDVCIYKFSSSRKNTLYINYEEMEQSFPIVCEALGVESQPLEDISATVKNSEKPGAERSSVFKAGFAFEAIREALTDNTENMDWQEIEMLGEVFEVYGRYHNTTLMAKELLRRSVRKIAAR